MMEVIGTYMYADEVTPLKPRKTRMWEILDGNKMLLGTVAWYGRWRQYAFCPVHNSVFEKTCLRDLAKFCELKTQAHRRRKKN